MSDRKLLELAAKAAGYKRMEYRDDVPYVSAGYLPIDGWAAWNPLADDGDAFRLAVKLRITPHIDSNMTDAECEVGNFTESHLGDPCAATRRAIVRAAAEIGKAMP